ncbi:F-box/kelch-repeat protein [Carex littledalei]|uniref:F-box/kelch-repeat protein n=1 Tax=Carex littledalei TaxID=544730 RepID=A0A833QLD8_9POAL|nr:F-box/kelch-repeat protein [Carex littledalei]
MRPTTEMPGDKSDLLLSSPTNIQSLPDDLLAKCFLLLPVNYLPCLALVCRRFAHILQHFPDFASCRCRPFSCISNQRKLIFLSVSSDLTLLTTTSCILSSSCTPTSFHFLAFPLPPNLLSMNNMSHASTIIIGSCLYLIGSGFNLCIDIVTGIAKPCAPTLLVRSKFSAALIGGKIYVAGGANKSRMSLEEYDPCSDKWQVIATNTPYGLSGCYFSIALKDQLYFFAGGANPSVMFVYNPSTGLWANFILEGIIKLCPSAAHVVGACQAGDWIYLLIQSDKYIWFFGLNQTERGHRLVKECRWTTIKYCVHSVVHFGCTAIGDDKLGVLIEASIENEKTDVTIMVFDLHTFEWIHVPDLVSPFNATAFAGVCSWV